MIQKFGDGSWTSEKEAILNHKFPLHRACRDGEAEVLKQLLSLLQNNVSNADVLNSEEDYYYWSAVHFAAYFGKLDCLRLLVQAAAVFNSSRASLGLPPLPCPLSIVSSHGSQTPLMVAAFANYPDCIDWIMQSNPGNLDFQDNVGETALHKACRSGALSCVQLLVAGKANTRLRNNNGQSAAELAVSCGHCGLGGQLAQLTKGAEPGNGHAASPVPTTPATAPSCTPAITHLVSSNGYYGYQHTHQNGHVNSQQQNGGDAQKQNGVTPLAPTTMDTSDSEMQDQTVACPPNLLTNQCVAQDLVPVAGKKRGREEEACQSAGKRGRFQDTTWHDGAQRIDAPSTCTGGAAAVTALAASTSPLLHAALPCSRNSGYGGAASAASTNAHSLFSQHPLSSGGCCGDVASVQERATAAALLRSHGSNGCRGGMFDSAVCGSGRPCFSDCVAGIDSLGFPDSVAASVGGTSKTCRSLSSSSSNDSHDSGVLSLSSMDDDSFHSHHHHHHNISVDLGLGDGSVQGAASCTDDAAGGSADVFGESYTGSNMGGGGHDTLSGSSGCSGCIIPAPAHLLARDGGGVSAGGRRLLGGHFF